MSVLNKFVRNKETSSFLWQKMLEDCIIDLAWSMDGKILVAATVNGPINLFDTKTGSLETKLSGHKFGTMSIAWSSDGKEFASSGQDGHIKLWDLLLKEPRFILPGGSAWVEHLAWSPTGKFLASSAGRSLRLWNDNGELLGEYPDHISTITDIIWRPIKKANDELLFATSCYGSVQVWSPKSMNVLRKFEWKGSILKMSWSPDGNFLATGDQDSTVHFWIMATGTDLQMWGYPTKVRELSWDPTSRYLATGGGTEVTIWDCSGRGPEGTKPIVLKLHEGLISQLAYQNKGNLLASAAEDGIVAVWNPERNKKPLVKKHYPTSIEKISWSPDDKLLAVGGTNGLLEVIAINY